MRKRLLTLLIILLFVGNVAAIPSLTVHTDDEERIKWEKDGVEDGNDMHNHGSGWNFNVPPNLRVRPQSPSVYGCWDNRNFRTTFPNVANFRGAHGFINEFDWLINNDGTFGGKNCIPTYSFATNVPANVIDLVTEAFKAWSSIESDRDDLLTGIEFRPITTGRGDIHIEWRNIDDLGMFTPATRTITFDSDPDNPKTAVKEQWYFNINPAGTPANQFHFYSTALHEIGHAVGLFESGNNRNVMIWKRGTGPNNPPASGPAFGAIDADSIRAVRDLYSIPAPDWGDAPDPYPVKWAKNGPYCPQYGFEWLGPRPKNGVSSTTGEKEPKQINKDLRDDGCKFTLWRWQGKVEVTISVKDHNSNRYKGDYKLYLAIWIDWNSDNDWKANERIVLDSFNPSTWAGDSITKTYNFNIPNPPWIGGTWARARLVYAKSDDYLKTDHGDEKLLPHADSPDNGGEIEDYFVSLYYDIPDTRPPHVLVEKPKMVGEMGITTYEPKATIVACAFDDYCLASVTLTHEWGGGSNSSYWVMEENITYYLIEHDVTLHEGWNSITIEAYDLWENMNSTSLDIYYVIDEEAPTIQIDNPDGQVVEGKYVNITGVITDEWEIYRLDYTIVSGETVISDEWTIDPTTSQYNISWRMPLKYGENVITIGATDKAGNHATKTVTIIREDTMPPMIEMIKPENALYIFERKILSLPSPLIIGGITIVAEAYDNETGINRVEFYIDEWRRATDYDEPYEWLWDETAFMKHTIKVVAYDNAENSAMKEREVWIFNI